MTHETLSSRLDEAYFAMAAAGAVMAEASKTIAQLTEALARETARADRAEAAQRGDLRLAGEIARARDKVVAELYVALARAEAAEARLAGR